MMKKMILSCVAVAACAASVSAQPFYARGTFNGWSGEAWEMSNVSGDHYSVTVTGLTPGNREEFKGTNIDWSFNGPNDNVHARADTNGELEIHFWATTSHGDGWAPEGQPRVGFTDTHSGWEIMGSFNGFSSPVATFSDIGGGILEASWVAGPGTHDFKARALGDWEVSIGTNFGGGGGNIVFDAGAGGLMTMQLDTVGGRYRVFIPAPGAVALLGLGGLALIRRR